MKFTKADYEEYLNDLDIPEQDKKSNGGLIPDYCKYGSWIRRNDPIAFEVGFNEYKNNFLNNWTKAFVKAQK